MKRCAMGWSALALVALSAPTWATNVISVTGGTSGTDFTIDQTNGTVKLLRPPATGTAYNITADNDSTTTTPNDGYINSITLDTNAQTSTTNNYRIRIAAPDGLGFWTTGAKYVGWVDVAETDKRGVLEMVNIKGQWGKKVVSGTPTDVSTAEVTRLFNVKNDLGDNNPHFKIEDFGDESDSGSIGVNGVLQAGAVSDSDETGWSLSVSLAKHLRGSIQVVDDSVSLNASTILVSGDLTGSLESYASIAGTSITINGDLSGSIIADTDQSDSGGDINTGIFVNGSVTSTGKIIAYVRTVGATQINGEIQKKIDILHNFAGEIRAKRDLPLGSNAWVRINWDGVTNGLWQSGGVVEVNNTVLTNSSSAGTTNAERVYWISNLICEMDGDRSRTNFDIDPFVLGLSDAATYNLTYPQLLESRIFHGDCNQDTSFDNFDVDCFSDCIASTNCPN